MEDTGTGLDYGTRPDQMPGYLVPNDRFYIRSHPPTPQVDTAAWTLRVERLAGHSVARITRAPGSPALPDHPRSRITRTACGPSVACPGVSGCR